MSLSFSPFSPFYIIKFFLSIRRLFSASCLVKAQVRSALNFCVMEKYIFRKFFLLSLPLYLFLFLSHTLSSLYLLEFDEKNVPLLIVVGFFKVFSVVLVVVCAMAFDANHTKYKCEKMFDAFLFLAEIRLKISYWSETFFFLRSFP